MRDALVKRGLGLLVGLMVLGGCRAAGVPDYAKPLGPGEAALRAVSGERAEGVLDEAAGQMGDAAFVEALRRSVAWFGLPSARGAFPVEGVTYERARRSAEELLAVAEGEPDAARRAARLRGRFGVYESVGYNGEGVVLFTGYFSPQFTASRERTREYRYPLYARPADLVTDAATGRVLGRSSLPSGPGQPPQIGPYPTRQEIEAENLLAGSELVYLPSRLDAYTIEVNGSAALEMKGGETLYVGYAGTNGREYTSIGKLLVADGKLDRNRVSMPAIRGYFREHPDELAGYIRRNERFVFFREYPGSAWPAGSLGFKVTPGRTLATDKSVFPRGGAVVVETTSPGRGDFTRLMVDQDTGGAIRAPGRADIYFGIGESAEGIAGRMAAEGRLYYLLLKPGRVMEYDSSP